LKFSAGFSGFVTDFTFVSNNNSANKITHFFITNVLAPQAVRPIKETA